MARPKKTAPALTKFDLDPLLTDQELADLLKVPLSWVEHAAKEERIPCLFVGRHRRYRPEHYLWVITQDERPARNAA